MLYCESTKIYICNELYLCDEDMKLALWTNEANMLHDDVHDMLFVMVELDFSLILLLLFYVFASKM